MAENIKSEPVEDGIDDINTRVQHLLEETDLYLSALRNRSSLNNSLASSSSYTAASTSRDIFDISSSGNSANDSITAELLEADRSIAPGEQTTAIATAQLENSNSNSNSEEFSTRVQHLMQEVDTFLDTTQSQQQPSLNNDSASSSGNSVEATRNIPPEQSVTMDTNDSEDSGSDATVLYSHDEAGSTSTNSPITIADNSFASEVIVVDPSTAEIAQPPPRRGRSRRMQPVRALDFDDSVIDLSNVTLPLPIRVVNPVDQEVIILSDEEDAPAGDAEPPVAVPVAPAAPTSNAGSQNILNTSNPRVSVHVNGVTIAVHPPAGQHRTMQLRVSHRRHDRNRFDPIARQQPEHNYTRDTFQQYDHSVLASTQPITTPKIPRPPGAPPAPSPRPNNGSSPSVLGKEIICPICYESLVDRPALSTICGHLFCAPCITRAHQLTKKCPMCKRNLPRSAHTMHPIYFTLS